MEEAPIFDETKPFESIPIEEAPSFDMNAEFKEVVNTPTKETVISENKTEELTPIQLIDKEYKQKINLIDTELLKVDSITEYDDETKQKMKDGFDIKKTMLEKQRQQEIDKVKPPMKERINDEINAGVDSAFNSVLKVTKMVNQITTSGMELIGFDTLPQEMKRRINEASSVWGEEVAIQKADRLKKYGEETWGVGETIGEVIPDVGVGVITAPTKIATGLSELALSSARNELFTDTEVPLMEKLQKISGDVGLAVVGMGVIQHFLPTSQLAELKELTSKIKDPVERDAVAKAYRMLDHSDISSLDYNAREKILKKIVTGEVTGEEALSKVINNEVQQAKDILSQDIAKEYDIVKEIAKTTEEVSGGRLNANFESWFNRLENKDDFSTFKQEGSLEDFTKRLSERGNSNAYDLEGMISSVKREARATTDKGQEFAYNKLVGFLQEEQDKLLVKSGVPGLYDKARELTVKNIETFTSKAKGEEAKTAKKLAEVLSDKNSYNVAEKLFTSNLDPNIVKGFLKATKGTEEARTAVMDSLLTKGVENINSKEGITNVLNNYYNLDANGRKLLLGEANAKALDSNVKAATIIMSAIEESELDKKIRGDVMSLVGAGLTAKLTPYVSAKVALQSSRNIVTKMSKMNKERSTLYKAIAGNKLTPATRKILQGLGMITLSQRDDEEETKE